MVTDPLYETIPANETQFSEVSTGINTFKSLGQIPQPIQNLPKEMAIITIGHTPLNPHSQEISAYEGQKVLVLKQSTYWTYILDEFNQMGYVPTSHLSIATDSSNSTLADTRSTPNREYANDYPIEVRFYNTRVFSINASIRYFSLLHLLSFFNCMTLYNV